MKDIQILEPIIIGKGLCELGGRFLSDGTPVIEKIDPGKMSLYGQMTLEYFGDIKKGRDILVKGIVKKLRQILLQILESSYLESSSQETKKYYLELIQNADKLEEFLKYKIWWIYKNIITQIPKNEEKEVKRSLFQNYLVSELTYMIKYFEEFVFIQTNKNPDSFGLYIERYKHILVWGMMRYQTLVPASDRDDLYQEFCIVLWNCINKWCGTAGDYSKRKEALGFEPYLRRSIQNKVKDIHRSQCTEKRRIAQYTSIGFVDSGDNFLGRIVQMTLAREWEITQAENKQVEEDEF